MRRTLARTAKTAHPARSFTLSAARDYSRSSRGQPRDHARRERGVEGGGSHPSTTGSAGAIRGGLTELLPRCRQCHGARVRGGREIGDGMKAREKFSSASRPGEPDHGSPETDPQRVARYSLQQARRFRNRTSERSRPAFRSKSSRKTLRVVRYCRASASARFSMPTAPRQGGSRSPPAGVAIARWNCW